MYGFIHIPKTAGRAFVTALLQNAPQDTVHIAGLFELANFPDLFDETRILTGHIPRFVYDWMRPQRRLVTILRDPVERVLSGYRYANTSESHPAFRAMCKHRPSIAACLQHPYMRSEFSNFQTKMLGMTATAKNVEWPPKGMASAKDFAVSLTELQYMPVRSDMLARAMMLIDTGRVKAACLEHNGSVLALCSEMTGHKVTEIPRVNETLKTDWVPSAADIALIQEHNQIDIALYKYALERI